MTTTVTSAIRIAGATNPPPDYTLASLWEDDIPTDLVAIDQLSVGELYADWPAPIGLEDNVVFTPRTVNSINHIDFKGAPGQSNDGIPGAGAIITGSDLIFTTLDITCDYTDIFELEVRATRISENASCINLRTQHSRIAYNILEGSGINGSKGIAVTNSLEGRFAAYNLIHNCSTGIHATRQLNMYNNVIVNCEVGFMDTNTAYSKNIINNIAYNNGIDFSFNGINPAVVRSNNASGDLTADGDNSITGVVDGDFFNAFNNDYHLAEGSKLIGAGLNLIENGYLDSPQLDIDGDLWPDAGLWDIGFDKYIFQLPEFYTGDTKIFIEPKRGYTFNEPKRGNDFIEPFRDNVFEEKQ